MKAALADLEQRHLRRTRRVDLRGSRQLLQQRLPRTRTHPEVVRAFQDAAAKYGVGSGASHLVTGHGPNTKRSSRARRLHRPRKALVFSPATWPTWASLARWRIKTQLRCGQAQSCVIDRWLPAARGALLRYRHGDAGHRVELLAALDAAVDTRLLITDGVFSMDGDVAPLPSSRAPRGRPDAWLIVDDAHGLGVVGATGRGPASTSV
jgi:8-amino-7-oxononanoate synthase